MAYTTVDKQTAHFNTKLYTGNGGTNAITGVGFQPDKVWIKERNGTNNHEINDAIRGVNYQLYPNLANAQTNAANHLTAFGTDGFTVGSDGALNTNSNTYVSWNWLAGGTTPSQTYTVKVVSDSGNKYRFDDFGTSAVTLDLQEGGTYTFDQSDSSNATHPLRFYTASDKSGGEYTTGVTTNGTPGSSGAYTRITVAASAPTLYYQCSSHAGMGGQANTNSTFGSSNFSGSIQSTVSANTTAGFSMVSYTGTGSNPATIGHGLGVTPKMIIVKPRSIAYSWCVYHVDAGAGNLLYYDTNGGAGGSSVWNSTSPTSSVFTGNDNQVNKSGETHIAYCFADVVGYSKFGSYKGNGNADGTFIYTGFKPAFVMFKRSDGGTENWALLDSTRSYANVSNHTLAANLSNAESSFGGGESVFGASNKVDILSNGIKIREASNYNNTSGATYIYMAFGQTIVGSNDVPATAR